MAIYKRGEVYWYDFRVAKKRERGSTGEINKRKAEAFHEDMKSRKKREANGLEVPIINKLTIYEALDLYLSDPELIASCRASSLLTKRHVWLGGDRVNRPKKKGSLVLKDIIKDAPLHTLGDKNVDDIIRISGQHGAKISTVNSRIAQLKAFSKWCSKKKHLAYDPLADSGKLEQPEQAHKLIGDDDLQRLFASVPTWLREIIWVDWQVGARLSNIVGLRYDQVDYDNACLVFTPDEMKKGKAVRIDLEPVLVDWFRIRQLAHPDETYVWPSPYKDKAHYAAQHVSQTFSVHARRLGLNCTFHSIRHTFATRWAEDGMDLPALGKLLSHRSLASTQIYVHVEDLHVQRQAKKKITRTRKAPELRLVHHADS